MECPFFRVGAVRQRHLRSDACPVGTGLRAIRIAAKAAPRGTRNLRARDFHELGFGQAPSPPARPNTARWRWSRFLEIGNADLTPRGPLHPRMILNPRGGRHTPSAQGKKPPRERGGIRSSFRRWERLIDQGGDAGMGRPITGGFRRRLPCRRLQAGPRLRPRYCRS